MARTMIEWDSEREVVTKGQQANGHDPNELTAHDVHIGLRKIRRAMPGIKARLEPLQTKFSKISSLLDGGFEARIDGRLVSRETAQFELASLRRQIRSLSEKLSELESQKKALEKNPNNTASTIRELKGPRGAAERKQLRDERRRGESARKNQHEQRHRFKHAQRLMLLSERRDPAPKPEEMRQREAATLNGRGGPL